ncbi:MAG TPA: sporulation protein [Geobacter sp.]|nr:sporulation protein [Geobacter sp.]
MRFIRLLVAVIAVAALAACNSSKEPSVKEKGAVTATTDFVRHFGPAPSVEKGTAFAFVIYFPSAKEPGRVIPFPFFSFDQASLQKVALLKLIGGLGDMKSYQGEVSQPFPQGVRVLDVVQSKGVVTVNFSKELGNAKTGPLSRQDVVNALQLTLKQFKGVSRVAFQVEGKDVAPGKRADESAVVQLSAPRLLSVTAMKDKGAASVEEVDVFFDRPVQIRELKITGTDGKPYLGDIYQSVFDMAAVVKVKDQGQFQPGKPVNVRWSVTDNLGRNGSGQREVMLELKEH